MASALAGPMLTRTRSSVAASAVLMLTVSAAAAEPASSRDSNSVRANSMRDFVAVDVMTIPWAWARRCGIGFPPAAGLRDGPESLRTEPDAPYRPGRRSHPELH